MKNRAVVFLLGLLFTSTSTFAAFWQPQAPYIEGVFGGTTFQAQTTHQSLLSFTQIGGVTYQTPDTIYTRIQQSNSLDILGGGAVGFSINPVLRTAIGVRYFKNTLDARNYGMYNSSTSYIPANTWLYTANFYIDFQQYLTQLTNVDPYVGVGLGAATNHLDTQTTYVDSTTGQSLESYTKSETHTDFAYQFMAGINYQLTRNLLLSLEYAFVNAGQYVVGNSGVSVANTTYFYTQRGKFSIYANQFTGGLIYRFV